MMKLNASGVVSGRTASSKMAVVPQSQGARVRSACSVARKHVASPAPAPMMRNVISRIAVADNAISAAEAKKLEASLKNPEFIYGSMVNARGQRLHTVTVMPPEGVARVARLFWHHGLGEHSGRYEAVFTRLAKNGLIIHSYDAHGHGKSEPLEEKGRAFIDDFRHLPDDMMMYVDSLIGENQPNNISSDLPLFMCGHSVGGLTATLSVLRRMELFNGLCIHSAAINVEMTPAMKAMVPESAVLSVLLPNARIVPAVRAEDMSQDPEVIRKTLEDPLNVQGRQSMRTATQLLKGFQFMAQNNAQLYLPIYAAHGTQDKCTSAKAVRNMLTNSTSEDVTMNMIEGGFHEMLHGPESEQCTTDLINWIYSHLNTGTDYMPNEKVIKTKGVLTNKRGQRLYNVTYKPSEKGMKARARIFFHHGLGEHAGRYDKVFTELAENGIVVHAMDAHGHGRSEPMDPKLRCFIADYNHLVEDVYEFIDSLTGRNTPAEFSRLPLFMVGHSVGGLTTALTVLKRQEMWSGMVLHSAAINVEWTPALRLMSRRAGTLSKLFPHAKIVPAVRAEDMNSDADAIKATMEDGLNASGRQQMRTSEQLLRAFQFMEKNYDKFRLPIYACHGLTDKCTSISAVEALLRGSKSLDVVLNGIEGGYHEMFHGPERELCTRKLIQWLHSKAPPLP